MSKLGTDQFPKYRQAGLKKDTKDESTAICLSPPKRDLQTPQQILHYRKSYKEQPAVTIKHYGTAKDPLPNEHFTYGIPTQKCDGVGVIMKASSKEGVSDYVCQIQQAHYLSQKREPLGKTIDRKYEMPLDAKSSDFKFGLPTEKNKYDVKQTIYSGQNMPQPQHIRQMYLKSHGDFDSGEQKNRNYNWNIQPSDFRFGKVQKNVIHNQIKQVLSPELHSEAFPQTKFIKTNQNDFINRKQDKLGKPANLGQKQFPPDHAFGIRIQPNEWNAGKCLTGEASKFQVREDHDLGRSSKPGLRNIPKEGDEARVFGVPTIRYDIAKPNKVSIADPNNYADETTAIELLFPLPEVLNGVDESDFNQVRSKIQIRQIFQNIGFVFKGNIFDAIFERSKVIHGTILNKVSCTSFKKAIYELCGK